MNLLTLAKLVSPVFIFTLIGYFAAYAFEVGYLKYFDISWQNARVTINSFMIAAVFSVIGGFLIRQYLYPLLSFLQTTSHNSIVLYMKKRLFVYFWLCIFGLSYSYVFKQPDFVLIILALVGGYFMIDIVVGLLFHLRPGKSLKQTFEDMDHHEQRQRKADEKYNNVITETFESIVRFVVPLTITFVVGGYSMAQVSKNIAVFTIEDKEYFVVRNYDGFIVGKAVNNGKPSSGIVLVNSNNTPLTLKESRIFKK